MGALYQPIARIANLSSQDWKDIVLRERPIIIEKSILEWPACENWTPKYLAERVGNFRVTTKRSNSHVHPEVPKPLSMSAIVRALFCARTSTPTTTMTLRDYLGLITSSVVRAHYFLSGDEVKILSAGTWIDALAGLRRDFTIPLCVPPSELTDIGLWLSAAGVRSHLHFDGNGCHNVNAQIVGTKHVELFAPDQAAMLYRYSLAQRRWSNFSQIDLDAVDSRRFPLFEQLPGWAGELHAGDLLFIPAYWFHSFKHLDPFNCNVNFWWPPAATPTRRRL